MTQAFAFFDFDDTLAQGDSILPYLLFCIRRGIAPRSQVFRAALGFLRWKLNPASASNAKSATLSFLKGHPVDQMDDLARDFFREYARRIYPDGRKEMERLKEQGVRVVVVSASVDAYMRVLPEFLPVDDVLSTHAITQDGRYTGAVGENCKGEEKVRRIESFLRERGLTLDAEHSSAYGDSLSDAYMMDLVAHAVLVNPKKKLLARCPGGTIVHWKT